MKTEPNKLEEQFRQKLEQRTIQPREMAWDRLDAMLSVAEKKKKKPRRAWMYIAASFLVFATLGALFLTRGDDSTTTIEQDAVVTQETQPAKAGEALPVKKGTVPQPQEEVLQSTMQVASVQPTNTKQRPSVRSAQQNTITVQGEGSQVIISCDGGIAPAPEAEQFIAEVTPQETTKKKSSLKVDANSLLSSVEGELDDSFREKAYKGVVKNFNAVKTAVVNRNYQ